MTIVHPHMDRVGRRMNPGGNIREDGFLEPFTLIQRTAMMIKRVEEGWMVNPHIFWGEPENPDDHSVVIMYKFRDAWLNAFHYAKWMP